jgi:hypothetical protein
MSGQSPDPDDLSPEAKDALIRDLRRQLAAAHSEARLLKRRLGSARQAESEFRRELLSELRAAPPRRADAGPSRAAMRLGRHLGLWRSPVVLGAVSVVLLAFAVDAGVGWYQARALKQHRLARLQLENAAFTSLYVELQRIVPLPDGKSFRMTLSMQNVNAAVPLYVMLNPVAVYVQSGTAWQQVPSTSADGRGTGVVTVTDAYSYDVDFTPDVANWAELIPGYMHVRIQDDMLVSRRAQPGDDVVERRTPIYVYLKPQGANDADIKARSHMSGKPPIFIPMPPH